MTTQRQLLDDLAAQCDATGGDVEALSALSEPQLVWQPAPGHWSVAQCLSHLVVTDEAYFPQIEKAFERAKANPDAADSPHRTTITGRFFLRSFGEKKSMAAKAPSKFQPQNHAAAVSIFLEHQAAFRKLIERARQFDTNQVRLASPLTRLIRFRVGECLAFLLSHQRRHLGQAHAVTREKKFPAKG